MRVDADNMISMFTVHLAHEIDLGSDSWEMALFEFLCPTYRRHTKILRGFIR